MRQAFAGFQCSLCQSSYSLDEVMYVCPKDGGNLDLILEKSAVEKSVSPDLVLGSSDWSIWRYLPLLPVEDPLKYGTPLRAVGWTPIFSLGRLAEPLGLVSVWIKDESCNPTASFKDRASAIVIARALEISADVIVTASTGNAGAALAGMAASAGQKAVIFAPRSAPMAKIAQLLIYHANVILVDGSYDDAFDLTVRAAQEFGWYCRNTGYNPFTLEGKKTAAFEIWEWWRSLPAQETRGKTLSVFVSVGDGNIISGIHKGFKDLMRLGWLEQMPRIFGVQAEGSAAIAKAFHAGTEVIQPVSAQTLADSIAVDLPRDGIRAVRAARETGGSYITVSDAEILGAVAELGRIGIFAEPAGAAAYAGLVKAVNARLVKANDLILVINTGSGLKDVKAAIQAVREAPVIEPTLEAVHKIVNFL